MKSPVQSMVLSALMTALMCIFSQVSFPVGITAATLQTFIVALAGYMLPARQAVFSCLTYLMLGACGLPVFSLFSGGLGVLMGATGGFLIGFPAMAGICALSRKRKMGIRLLAGAAGLMVVYISGTLQLSLTAGLSIWQAAATGVLPFVWKDVLSIAGACFLARTITRRMRNAG